MNNIDAFVQDLANKAKMVPINSEEILAVEASFNFYFPQSYKYLISTYGLVHTPNVLTKVCDLNSNISEVQDFLSLDDILSLSNLYELSGMPKGHVLFASDCKGNMFCFKQSDCKANCEDAPVWFYEHGSADTIKVANSFTQWLEQLKQ